VDHADGAVAAAADPARHERGFLGEPAVPEVEAVLAVVAVRARPGDGRDAGPLDDGCERERVVGYERADDAENALLGEVEVAVDRVLRLEPRKADRLLHDELHLARDDPRLVRLVEREAKDGEEVVLRAHVEVDQDPDFDGGEGEAVRERASHGSGS